MRVTKIALISVAVATLAAGQDTEYKSPFEGNPYLPKNWTDTQRRLNRASDERLLRLARPVAVGFLAGASDPMILPAYDGTTFPPCSVQSADSTLFDLDTGKVWYCLTDGRRVAMEKEHYTVLVTYGASQVYRHLPHQVGLDVSSIR